MSHESSDSVELEFDSLEQLIASGSSSGLVCPECGGSLWQVDSTQVKRYQCHVGHAFVPESLLKQQSEEIERHLWTVLRLLQEQAIVARQLAAEARSQNRPVPEVGQLEIQVQQAVHQVECVRQLLRNHPVNAVLETGSMPPSD